MIQELPNTLREATPVGYLMVKHSLDRDAREHERLITRRDWIRDKLRSGLTTLNAGSLIALLAILNGKGDAMSWFGIDKTNAQWIAALFTLGLIAAAASFRITMTETLSEIADSTKRVFAIEHIVASYEGKPTEAELKRIADNFQNYAALPIVGNRFSDIDFWCLALSQGFWVTGVAIPMFETLSG